MANFTNFFRNNQKQCQLLKNGRRRIRSQYPISLLHGDPNCFGQTQWKGSNWHGFRNSMVKLMICFHNFFEYESTNFYQRLPSTKYLFWFSQILKTEKKYFLTNKNFVFFFNWELLVKNWQIRIWKIRENMSWVR